MLRKVPDPSDKVEEWPLLVKRGSVIVKIYRGENVGRPLFTLSYYTPEGRQRQNFRDFAEAQRKANDIAEHLHRGEQSALRLSDAEAGLYREAMKVLQPTGKTINVAASEYAEAFELLEGTGTLAEACRFFAKNHGKVIQKTVADVLKEFTDAQKASGASQLYLDDIDKRLGRFSESFATFISSVTTAEIENWIQSLQVGGRTQNNFRNLLITFFRFARKRGYLPRDRATEAEAVSRAKEKRGEVGILTPDQMQAMLNTAKSRNHRKVYAPLIPFICLGGFAGLRHWELLRLEWKDINFKEGHILLVAAKAKTAQRRIVPISPNLKAWLAGYRDKTGSVAPPERVHDKLVKLAQLAEFDWPHNGLRHSYGSYRLAQIKSAAQVSLEMGNSPQMVFRHYREVVTEKEAARWFAIRPSA